MADDAVSLRSSLWVSSLITLAGLAVFIALSSVIPPFDGIVPRVLLGLGLALVPAVLWILLFYQMDNTEPEPKRLVLRMMAFGALAAAALPLVYDVTLRAVEQAPSLIWEFFIALVTISLFQEALKLAMVRYVVLGTNEFDQYPDGIIYGLAAGVGFATLITISYVVQSGGLIPLAGAIYAVENILVHGALGAISGYYIGRIKIDGKNVLWMLQGLAIVTVANAAYYVFSTEFSRQFGFSLWNGLLIAFALSVLLGGILFYVFRRATLRATGALQTVSLQISARSKDMPWDIHVRYDHVIIVAVLLPLILGTSLAIYLPNRQVQYTSDSLATRISYPASWSIQSETLGGLTLRNPRATAAFMPIMSVTEAKVRSNRTLEYEVADLLAISAGQLVLYNEIAREDVTVNGEPAIQVSYQYAEDTGSGPAIIYGTKAFVMRDSRLYTFTLESHASDYAVNLAHYEQLLRSVQFGQ